VPVLLALSGLGWAAAHALAHRAAMSERAMAGTGVDYLSYLTTSLALCFALALPLAAGAMVGKRWKATSARSLWLFGVVPVLGFAGHEVAEALLGGAGGPSTVFALAPIVLVGLAIQIPFALVVVGLARRILWLAESLGLTFAPRACVYVPRPAKPSVRPRAHRALGFRLELAHSERGPPPLPA
jgi:hypothetical protein